VSYRFRMSRAARRPTICSQPLVNHGQEQSPEIVTCQGQQAFGTDAEADIAIARLDVRPKGLRTRTCQRTLKSRMFPRAD
jgi:hypothetical protein